MPSSQDPDLKANDEQQNTNEHAVGVDTLKEVDFIVDLSGTKHVENLHPYEHVEDEGQVS